jgi:two-component system sensor histidine kinase BaeS
MSPHNETVGWVGTLSDVTAETAATTAMEAARDAALAASRTQRAFAESASHELKTPTASILGFMEEVLAGDSLSSTDRKHLDTAHRSALRLTRLIEDLLQLGTADLPTPGSQCEPTELSALIDLVLLSFVGIAESGGVNLSTDTTVEPIAELWAMADPLRLEQAITNLISNGLKFTPPGGDVCVRIRGIEDRVEIDIADTGIGIAESAIDQVFDRFYRAQGAIDAGITGSGLGLAIAQRMIEAQNGQLSVTSIVGQGSVFTITLPSAPRLIST